MGMPKNNAYTKFLGRPEGTYTFLWEASGGVNMLVYITCVQHTYIIFFGLDK